MNNIQARYTGSIVVIVGIVTASVVSFDWDVLFFGPPSIQTVEAYGNDKPGAIFDHSVLDELLHQYVSGDGLVDYAKLSADATELDRYIASLADAPFDRLGRDEKLAFLINAYNACTLRLILDHYPTKTIKDIPSAKRWQARRWTIAGDLVSLDDLEHKWIRPKFAEPRVHFALVCAAMGCPPLRNEAYAGARLDEQLDAQARYVHEHGRWLRLEPNKGVVHLTKLYKWYGDDFRQTGRSILEFAARYSKPLRDVMDRSKSPRIEWLNYDWSLNSIDESTNSRGTDD
ncbi:MAG: DUF547 domain-containing protein [Phycisphaerae bacterium]